MTIKQLGGVFGRNPTFNNVTIEGTLTFDGDIDINSDLTISGNLYLPDNSKAIFGDGSDLQIYHDGNDSRIDEVGGNRLILRSSDDIRMDKYTGENMGVFNADGSVDLYYDAVKKFETTATGIDVTGTVTADGLTVDGSATIDSGGASPLTISRNSGANSNVGIAFNAATNDFSIGVASTSEDFVVGTSSNLNTLNRLRVGSGGDISFYEDTGTTPKLFWDASAESLGIGTSTPDQPLHVYKSSGTVRALVETGGSTDGSQAGFQIKTPNRNWQILAKGSDNALQIYDGTAAAERLRIDASGNVGIGGTPTAPLHVFGGGILGASSTNPIAFTGSGGTNAGIGSYIADSDFNVYSAGTGNIKFVTGAVWSSAGVLTTVGAEAMRIDSSGNLLVGTTDNNVSNNSGIANSGINLLATGQILAAYGGNTANFNRLGSDGSIVNFDKDGTTVGSIGTEGGDMAIGNGDVGLQFINGGQTVRGFNMTTNARIDAQVDLGMASTRFKDLYLSGGVVFGTTGGSVSSKTLDDYEEGAWTPADGSGAALTFSTAVGTYVKVGNLVTVAYSVTYPSTADTTDMAVGGLPFAPDTNFIYGGSQSYTNKAAAFDCSVTTLSSKIVYRTGGTSAQIHNNDLSSGSIRGSITYQV